MATSPSLPLSPSSSPSSPSSSSPALPLPLSTSILLTQLPRDATTALQQAHATPTSLTRTPPKVTVRFKAVGSAPILRQQVCKISATARFESVVTYLGRMLRKTQQQQQQQMQMQPNQLPRDGSPASDMAATANPAMQSAGGVFCYVNSSFAPGLDEVVGNLYLVCREMLVGQWNPESLANNDIVLQRL